MRAELSDGVPHGVIPRIQQDRAIVYFTKLLLDVNKTER